MDSKIYLDILKKYVLPIHNHNDTLIFQDDNDPKHRSKNVTSWKNEIELKHLKWPSNSPDLNPIENIWAILKRKIARMNIANEEEFISIINDKWKEINVTVINNIIDSMASIILTVIERKGDYIDY
jgi:transposase